MYKVVIPFRIELAIQREIDFWSQKDPCFCEKVAATLNFHLNRTLKNYPGFGALATKRTGLLYYPIEDSFKLVFEIDELNKQVLIHQFFHNRRRISGYY